MTSYFIKFRIMTSAFSPDGSEPLGRTLRSEKLRPETESVVDFYQLDLVIDYLKDFEGKFFQAF